MSDIIHVDKKQLDMVKSAHTGSIKILYRAIHENDKLLLSKSLEGMQIVSDFLDLLLKQKGQEQ